MSASLVLLLLTLSSAVNLGLSFGDPIFELLAVWVGRQALLETFQRFVVLLHSEVSVPFFGESFEEGGVEFQSPFCRAQRVWEVHQLQKAGCTVVV